MSLQVFKCTECDNIPDLSDVFVCSNSHIYCLKCAKSCSTVCRCSCDLEKHQNPLEYALQNCKIKCSLESKGCTKEFFFKDRESHEKECMYRQYSCVGQNLNAWKCSWKGMQIEFRDHFKTSHTILGSMLSYNEKNQTLPYTSVARSILKKIHLIDAFNKTFVLYYEMNPKTKSINIIIFLLGMQQRTKKYYYELEIFNPSDSINQIKYIQSCYNDTEDILKLIEEGKCVNVAYHVIKNYINKNNIHYRFRMIKKEI